MPVMLSDPNMGGGDVGFYGGSPTQEASQYQDPSTITAPFITQEGAQYSDPSGISPTQQASQYDPTAFASPVAYSQPVGGGGGVAGGGGSFPSGYTQQPQTMGGGGGGGGQRAAAPVVHHGYDWYHDINNQQGAITDPTYQMQRSALLGKLNDYERNVASQVGDQNIQQVSAPQGDQNYGLLGNYWKANQLSGPLYSTDKDINGNLDYKSNHALGGSLGTGYDSSLANFENQQVNGLRSQAEDFAARGMLGAGSGVFNNAHSNLQDQYNTQLGNLNNSAIQQYNALLSGLAQQNTDANSTLGGYLSDASNRMAQADMAGLPVHP